MRAIVQPWIDSVGRWYFTGHSKGEDIFNSPLGRVTWNAMWRFGHHVLTPAFSQPIAHMYWIDPWRIRYDAPAMFHPINRGAGYLADGDWDLPDQRVEFGIKPWEQPDYSYDRYGNVEVAYGFYEHFVTGLEWHETELYHHSIEHIEAGHRLWGFGADTVAEFETYCHKIDELYAEIAANGYQAQSELPNGRIGDEISVLIARDGSYIFNNGIHRLSIARVLGVPEVPIVVTARHPGWLEERAAVLDGKRENSRFRDHPDIRIVRDEYTTMGFRPP